MSDTDTGDDGIGLDDLTDEAVDELESRVADRLEANREDDEKEQLASEIIANSADYDSDDKDALLDTPVAVLEGLHANATAGATGVPGGGLSGNASGAGAVGDDLDAYPDGVMH